MGKITPADIKFLRKVEAGDVYAYFTYSMRRGGTYGFRGGEKMMEKFADRGLVTKPGAVSLGRPSKATLTAAGRQVLADADMTVSMPSPAKSPKKGE